MLLGDPDSKSLEHSEDETTAAAACSNNPNSQQGSVASSQQKIAECYSAGMYLLKTA